MKMNRLPKIQALVFQPDTDSKIGSQNENIEKFRQDIHYLPEFLLKRNQFHIEY